MCNRFSYIFEILPSKIKDYSPERSFTKTIKLNQFFCMKKHLFLDSVITTCGSEGGTRTRDLIVSEGFVKVLHIQALYH